MLYTQNGHYAKQLNQSNTSNFDEFLKQNAVKELPAFSGKEDALYFHHYKVPNFFAGELKNKQRKVENIISRDSLAINLNYLNIKYNNIDEAFEALSQTWPFLFYLYPTFNNGRKGLRLMAIIPLAKPVDNSRLYVQATQYLKKVALRNRVITKLGSKIDNIWTKPDSLPVHTGCENNKDPKQLIWKHQGKFTQTLDVTTSQFQTEVGMNLASDITADDALNTPALFDNETQDAIEIVKEFVNHHTDWLADYLNWLAATMAIKRAEGRDEIDHETALTAVKLLAGTNFDWQQNNANFYEDLDFTDTSYNKGQGMSFFITKLEHQDLDWLIVPDKGEPIVDAAKLGMELVHQYHYLRSQSLHAASSAIYVNEQWQLIDADHTMQGLITEALQSAAPVLPWKSRNFNEVWTFVKSYNTKHHFDGDPFETTKNQYLVQFKNGTLDLHTMTLREHRADDFLLRTVPFDYPENNYKTPQTTLKWITELFDGDEIAMKHFCAFIGMAFTQAYDKQEFIMLAGAGNNGKSTLINYIRTFFSSDDVTETSLADLSDSRNRFVTSQLYLRHLAITNESGNAFVKNSDIVKKVTGSDATHMEFKGRTPFSTVSYANLIGASNDLPTMADRTEGLKRRMIVIQMTQDFGSKQVREHFKHAYPTAVIAAETADMIRYCIECFYKSVLAPEADRRDYFVKSEQMQANTDKWAEQGDNVRDFFKECCVFTDDPHLGEKKMDLYKLYRWYVRDDGSYMLSRDRFTKELCRVAEISTENVLRFRMHGEASVRIRHIAFNQFALNSIYDDTASTHPSINLTGYNRRGDYQFAGEAVIAKQAPEIQN